MKKIMFFLVLTIIVSFSLSILTADEGMYTPDKIKYLNLEDKGLKIPVEEIFDPPNPGLYEAVIKMGATAEFVSPKGLILTNHHVAFGSVASISTPEKDYIKEGFLAKSIEEEIPASGYQGKILKLYEDVTDKVLKNVEEEMSEDKRDEIIKENIKKLKSEASNRHPELEEIEITSFFDGNKYYMRGFFVIKDIRIVYVPPRSIGEYGGDLDNWEWPRHTGDFSFLRAYVSKDGNGVKYSEDNVPYHPRTWFEIDTEGAKKDDFVFIMGFPGRTFRYKDSYFVEHEMTSRLPTFAEMFKNRIEVVEKERKKNKEIEIKYAGFVKGFNNVLKNYQSKIAFYKRVGLIQDKKRREKEFTEFINKEENLKEKYGNILNELKTTREKAYEKSPLFYTLVTMNWSSLIENAVSLYKYSLEKEKPAEKRNNLYQGEKLEKFKTNLISSPEKILMPLARHDLKTAIMKATELPDNQKFEVIEKYLDKYKNEEDTEKKVAEFTSYILNNTILLDKEKIEETLKMNGEDIREMDDPLLKIAKNLMEKSREYSMFMYKINKKLARLERIFTEGLMKYYESKREVLFPDANSTFRFTYGYVKGVEPRDAVIYKPVTTFSGVIEKDTGEEPYNLPEKLREIYKSGNYGRWVNPYYDDVTVCLLTNTDTTGGNSGSPLLNAEGKLIGCVFDRNFEGLTTDFKYQPELVRSISVDIRYVLFITEKFGAGYLLDEMGVR